MWKKLITNMFEAGDPTDPRAAFRNLRIIHAAFCVSVLIYGVFVALLLTYEPIPQEQFMSDLRKVNMLRTFLWLVGLGCFGAILYIRGRYLAPEALRGQLTSVMGSVSQWSIYTFAIAEAIAVLGLFLFLIAALLDDFLALAGISLLILFWLRPKEDEYHALVRQVLRP